MKNLSLLLMAVSILQFGCDSTGPDNETDIAYLELYWNNQVYYAETLTESDDGDSKEIILPDDTVVNLQKYVFTLWNSDLMEDQYWFNCLAAKNGYYSQYTTCAEEDTLRIYADSGFTAVEAGKICGLLYNKFTGSMRYSEVGIFNKSDSTFVANISTDPDGNYAIELEFGEYLLSKQPPPPYLQPEIVDFTLTSNYKDVMFIGYYPIP